MDQNLNVNIEMRLRQAGLDQLADKLKQTHGDLDKLSQTAASASSGMDTLGSSTLRAVAAFAGVGVGIGAAIAFVKTSVTEFAHLERQLNATAFQMTNLGIDSAKTMPQVRAFLEGLEASGNGLMSETVPAFQRFLGVTKDAAQAMALVKLSSDIAERGQIDLAGATNVLVQATQGRLKGAFNALGLSIRDANEDVMKSSEFFAEVQRQIGGTGDAMDDTQNKIETFTGAWAKLKRTVAEGPLGDMSVGFLNVATSITKATSAFLEFSTRFFTSGFGFKYKDINAAESADKARSAMGPPAPDPAFLAFMDKQAEIEAKAEAEKQRKAAEDRQKALDREIKQREDAEFTLARIAAKDQESISKQLDKARDDRIRETAEKNLDVIERGIQQYAEGEKEKERLTKEMIQAVLENTKAGSDQWVELETKSLNAWRNSEILKAQGDKERLLIIEKTYQAKIKKIRADAAAQAAADRKAEVASEVEAKQAILSATSTLIGAMFHQSKAAAMAQAVISAAQAILGIWEHWAWNPGVAGALTALTVAATAAQIATINSAEPGMSAHVSAGTGGGGHAAHFSPPTSQNTPAIGASGVHAGQAQAGGMTVINNFHGTVIDSRRAARDLSRTLTDASRRDQTRKVS